MMCTEGTREFSVAGKEEEGGWGRVKPACRGREERLSEGGDGERRPHRRDLPTEGGQGAPGWRQGPELTAGFSLPPPSMRPHL